MNAQAFHGRLNTASDDAVEVSYCSVNVGEDNERTIDIGLGVATGSHTDAATKATALVQAALGDLAGKVHRMEIRTGYFALATAVG